MISLIACINKNRGLGLNNQLLYKIPADQKFFRETTSGHVVIMGSKTFESIGRPLPNRTNIIISRDPTFKAEGCVVYHSIDEAIAMAQILTRTPLLASVTAEPEASTKEVFIIGGTQIYKQTIDLADKLYLTIVDDKKEADALFPEYETKFTKSKILSEGEYEGLKYQILELTK